MWKKDSWRSFPIKQHPTYEDKDGLQDTQKLLSSYPPLVFAGEVESLKQKLSMVNDGKAFLLQGGDCAESFFDFNANNIRDLFKVILQMSVVLTFASKRPVVKVGRIAGQFAKPRSSDYEEINGKKYPSYRGDIINSNELDLAARIPDPKRMIDAYNQSAATLNLIRAFATGGLADLRNIHKWNLDFIKRSPQKMKYEELAQQIEQALIFMESCGLDSSRIRTLRETSFFTSHEALLLHYEQALTREDSITNKIYDCSAHMLWIGDRTRGLDEAHVEFLRGVQNPIGIKAGPSITAQEIIALAQKLNPTNEKGKINVIVRMGEKIHDVLPRILREVVPEGLNIVWSSDPMHANTFKASSGYKTREFSKIVDELKSFLDICKSQDVYPGGIHLEMTGNDVTECVGGARQIQEDSLGTRYHSFCDPRLNAEQALELAFLVSQTLQEIER